MPRAIRPQIHYRTTPTLTLEEQYRRRLEARMAGAEWAEVAQQAASEFLTMIRGKSFSFTGGLGFMSRKPAVELIVENGGYYDQIPRRSTDYVVCGDIPLTAMIPGRCSRKLQRAHELGVNVISATSFKQMLTDAGLCNEEN